MAEQRGCETRLHRELVGPQKLPHGVVLQAGALAKCGLQTARSLMPVEDPPSSAGKSGCPKIRTRPRLPRGRSRQPGVRRCQRHRPPLAATRPRFAFLQVRHQRAAPHVRILAVLPPSANGKTRLCQPWPDGRQKLTTLEPLSGSVGWHGDLVVWAAEPKASAGSYWPSVHEQRCPESVLRRYRAVNRCIG